MRATNDCPHCGRPLLTAEDSDVVVALRREIAYLQATVARLRGMGSRYLPPSDRDEVAPCT